MDPRPLFGHTLDQLERLVATVGSDQLAMPTPCHEFDVRTLLGHVLSVLDWVRLAGSGRDPVTTAQLVRETADDAWLATYREMRVGAEQVWSEEASLDREVTVPWGTGPGRIAIAGYTMEMLTHAWDLAAAVGRQDDLDSELGASGLAMAQQYVPEEPRGGPVQFGPVVAVGEDADPYSRLAGWLGRNPSAPVGGHAT
ncbi:MAG: TIGR03086 family metal-binding protein [Sciscionella sp.]